MVRQHSAAGWSCKAAWVGSVLLMELAVITAMAASRSLACRFDTLRAEGFKGNTVTYSTLVKIAMKVRSPQATAHPSTNNSGNGGSGGHAPLHEC